MAAKSPVQIFDDLCDTRQPIYLANIFQQSRLAKGRPAGDIIIGIVDNATKRRMTLALPKNSITCVTDQVGHATLRDNPDIRRYLGNGVLELYSPEAYNELMAEDPDYIENSQDQLERLLNSLDGAPQESTLTPLPQPVVADIVVRSEIQALVAKVQFETETEKALIQELRTLLPLSDAEKRNLQDVVAAVPADRAKLRGVLSNLDEVKPVEVIKQINKGGRPKTVKTEVTL